MASVSSASLTSMLEPPTRTLSQKLRSLGVWAAIALVLAISWNGADMRPLDLIKDAGNMAEYASGFFPPDFHEWEMYLLEMWITIQIAIWGTFLSVVVGIPCAVLSSNNVVPWWICQPVRRLMDASRAINELVFAMLFVVAVGLGPFAGVLALFVHNVGVIAKLFSETVEAVDPRPVEGIRATGATSLHEVIFGIVPQVIPLWISLSLYRFETNVRSATVLGIVGAGGVGHILYEYIRGFYYAETAAVILVVVISVSLIDVISQRLRTYLI